MEQQDTFIEENTSAKAEVALRACDLSSSKNCTFILALFGFSHALAIFLTLLLTVTHAVCYKVFVTILCCMLLKLVSLLASREAILNNLIHTDRLSQ